MHRRFSTNRCDRSETRQTRTQTRSANLTAGQILDARASRAAGQSSIGPTAAKAPWGMMLNDTLGDCTCAAMGHEVQVATANHGNEVTVPDAAVLTAYEAVSGYVPGSRTPTTVPTCSTCSSIGAASASAAIKIVGFAKVNPLDWLEVRQAIALFGGMYIGLALPTVGRKSKHLVAVGRRPATVCRRFSARRLGRPLRLRAGLYRRTDS